MDREEPSWVPSVSRAYVKVDHRLNTHAKTIAV